MNQKVNHLKMNLNEEDREQASKKEKLTKSLHFTLEMTGSSTIC